MAISLPDSEEDISIAPNPSEGLMVVQLPKKQELLHRQVTIFNEMGVIVYTTVLNEVKEGHKYELDIQHLDKGFYYLQLNEPTVKRNKFVLR